MHESDCVAPSPCRPGVTLHPAASTTPELQSGPGGEANPRLTAGCRTERNSLSSDLGQKENMARMRRNPPATPVPGAPRPRRAPKVGQLRQSQVITTYGPGSMVDLPNGAVMVACLDTWRRGERIWDLNLENKLGGVAIYKLPTFNPPSGAQADPGTTF